MENLKRIALRVLWQIKLFAIRCALRGVQDQIAQLQVWEAAIPGCIANEIIEQAEGYEQETEAQRAVDFYAKRPELVANIERAI